AASLALAQIDTARAKELSATIREQLRQDSNLIPVAARALLLIDPDDREAMRVFASAFRPAHPARGVACYHAGFLGVQANKLVGAIRPLLKDPEGHVRSQAAVALWRITQDAADSLPVLTAMLKDPSQAFLRAQAAIALADMGAAAKEALPELKAAHYDPD